MSHPPSRYAKWFSADEVAQIITMRAHGATYREIGYKIGRTHGSIKGFVSRSLSTPRVEWPLR